MSMTVVLESTSMLTLGPRVRAAAPSILLQPFASVRAPVYLGRARDVWVGQRSTPTRGLPEIGGTVKLKDCA